MTAAVNAESSIGRLPRIFYSALLLGALCVHSEQGQGEPFEMDVRETDEVRVLFLDPFQTHLVPHVIRNVHNSIEFQKKTFDWTPNEKTTVILTDLRDYGNAGAGASPRNVVSVFIAPASRTLETMPSSERIFMIMSHEFVHIANMDAANASDFRWRRFFGGKPRQTDRHPESILYNYLAAPRLATPRWYLEGAAVFMETWMSGGVGRAQGAYDEMVFRAMVRDDAHFYSNLGLVSEGTSIDFQAGANAYLYGTRFITFLAYQYSPQQVIDWLKRTEDSERYYANQFRLVFGKPLEDAWQEWIRFEHEFQLANLDRVREVPLTRGEPLVDEALGSISRSFVDEDSGVMFGAFRYPGFVAHVGALTLRDAGVLRRIVDVKGPMTYRVTSSAWDPDTRTFFYTADNNAYRDLMAVNVDTGKSRMLLKDARIGDLVFSPSDRSIWGLRHLNGYVSLVQIPYPYDAWNMVYTWPYGQVAYELDISDDGSLISLSLGEIDGSQHLKIYRSADFATEEPEPVTGYEFTPAVPEGFVFAGGNRYLYGSSFITGVSNILRFDVETGQLDAVTNAETGFFRPIPRSDGSLIAFEYTGQGFVPVVVDPEPLETVSTIRFLGAELAARHPIVTEWNVIRSLRAVDEEKLVTHSGKYRPYRELEFDSGYPVLEGYRDTFAPGVHLRFTDPAQFHSAGVTLSYSLDGELDSSERLHAGLEYNALNWYARYWHNRADFYDMFGPTKRARKGDAYILGYQRPLIFDEPRRLDLFAEAAYYTGLDTLPANQNVSSLDIDEIFSLEGGLHFEDTRRSLGAVDHEKGWRWDAVLSADDTDLETVTRARLGLDVGFALPVGHASIWLYNSAGTTDGARTNPLGNYYFGGFGNNYVDDGAVKRYREYDSFPGFEIDEIIATEFVKSVVELNLPPIRFREVGTPSFFLSHIRPAAFVGTLVTDPGKPFEHDFASAGVQFDLSFTIAHHLPMTLSMGYAVGFESGDRQGDEWMLSLKIL